jgi:hypothetical protein
MPLTDLERATLIAKLESSRDLLRDAVRVSDEQWFFQPDPQTWSIAHCAQHLAESEARVLARIQALLTQPPLSENGATRGKEDLLARAVPNRSRRVQAPPEFTVSHVEPSPTAFLDRFNSVRAGVLDFTRRSEHDLHRYVFEHFVFRELTAYQWLLLLGYHTERHISQIEELKRHPAFPAAAAPQNTGTPHPPGTS